MLQIRPGNLASAKFLLRLDGIEQLAAFPSRILTSSLDPPPLPLRPSSSSLLPSSFAFSASSSYLFPFFRLPFLKRSVFSYPLYLLPYSHFPPSFSLLFSSPFFHLPLLFPVLPLLLLFSLSTCISPPPLFPSPLSPIPSCLHLASLPSLQRASGVIRDNETPPSPPLLAWPSLTAWLAPAERP